MSVLVIVSILLQGQQFPLLARAPSLCSILVPHGSLSPARALPPHPRDEGTAPGRSHRFLIAMRNTHVGSRWVSSLLRSHPQVASYREWFKLYRCCAEPPRAGRAPQLKPGMACPQVGDGASLPALWNHTLAQWFVATERRFEETRRAGGKGAWVGFKNLLPVDIAPQRPRQPCGALGEARRRGLEDAFFGALASLGVRVVCLHRANVLAQATSAAVRANPARGAVLRSGVLLRRAAEEAHFLGVCARQAARVPVFVVGYEELYRGDAQAVLAALQRFLGLEPRRLASSTSKHGPANHTARVANAAELAASPVLRAMLRADFGADPAAERAAAGCPPVAWQPKLKAASAVPRAGG